MKPKQLKPLRLFAWPNHLREGRIVYCDVKQMSNDREAMVPVRVFAVGEHRELVARIARRMWSNALDRRDGRETVRAVLTAVGIIPTKRRTKGRK